MLRATIITFFIIPLAWTINLKRYARLDESFGLDPGWGYTGELGPTNWGKLSSFLYNECNGPRQSPINIIPKQAFCDNKLSFQLVFPSQPIKTKVEYNLYTLEVRGKHDILKATTTNNVPFKYPATSLFFHAPSEHTIQGRYYDLEMRIVHKIDGDISNMNNNTFAIVAFFFEIGTEPNPLIDALELDSIGKEITPDLGSLISKQIGSNPAYYVYEGSLTTPPCSEIVTWYIIRKPLKITAGQLKSIKNRLANPNIRPLQDLNGRLVKLGGVTC